MIANDSELKRMFVLATDEVIPPAPWLESQVVDALNRHGRSRPVARGSGVIGGFGPGLRLVAGVAAVLVALVAVAALLMNTRLHSSLAPGLRSTPVQSPAPAPSRDAAVVHVRATLDHDYRAVDAAFNMTCKSRDVCAAQLVQVRAVTQNLIQTASATQGPAQTAPAVQRVMSAAQHFIEQIDTALVLIRQPNSDFLAAAALPSIYDLDLAMAELDCWPVAPVIGSTDGHSGASCA